MNIIKVGGVSGIVLGFLIFFRMIFFHFQDFDRSIFNISYSIWFIPYIILSLVSFLLLLFAYVKLGGIIKSDFVEGSSYALILSYVLIGVFYLIVALWLAISGDIGGEGIVLIIPWIFIVLYFVCANISFGISLILARKKNLKILGILWIFFLFAIFFAIKPDITVFVILADVFSIGVILFASSILLNAPVKNKKIKK